MNLQAPIFREQERPQGDAAPVQLRTVERQRDVRRVLSPCTRSSKAASTPTRKPSGPYAVRPGQGAGVPGAARATSRPVESCSRRAVLGKRLGNAACAACCSRDRDKRRRARQCQGREGFSFTLIYGSKGLERHLTVVQQEYRRAGVDMQLRLMEPGTAFERGLERKYEMTYDQPHQCAVLPRSRGSTCTANSWPRRPTTTTSGASAAPEVDALIKHLRRRPGLRQAPEGHSPHRSRSCTTRRSTSRSGRAPYIRVVHWDHLQFPDFFLPRRTEQLTDWLVVLD